MRTPYFGSFQFNRYRQRAAQQWNIGAERVLYWEELSGVQERLVRWEAGAWGWDSNTFDEYIYRFSAGKTLRIPIDDLVAERPGE